MKPRETFEDDNIYILVEKIKNGDREAFITVTRIYQKKVFLLAFSFFRNREDAMDIVQETFLRFYEKVNMFRRGKNFQNWLLQIAKNLCVDYYRKNYKRNSDLQREKNVKELCQSSYSQKELNSSLDIKQIFSKCIDGLSEKQRMVFLMKHYNQLEYKEIAQILSIALGTAKSLHFKALQNLKVLMSPYMGRQT